MRIVIFTLGLMFCLLASADAQERIRREGGRLEAYKIAYLTNKLKLSSEEAQKFWPIYNKYVNEIRQTRIQNRQTDEIDLEEKIVNIRKRYKNEFTQALPGERVNQFFKVDKEFNTTVMKELQERREINQMRKQNKRPYRAMIKGWYEIEDMKILLQENI